MTGDMVRNFVRLIRKGRNLIFWESGFLMFKLEIHCWTLDIKKPLTFAHFLAKERRFLVVSTQKITIKTSRRSVVVPIQNIDFQ